MNTTTILLVLMVLATFSYFLGRKRSLAVSNGNKGVNKLHSLPGYYGYLVAIWCVIPALLVLLTWNAFNNTIITQNVIATLPAEIQQSSESEIGLMMNRVKSMAESGQIDKTASAAQQAAAQQYIDMQSTSSIAKAVVVLALAIIGFFIGWRFIAPHVRARNKVEAVIRWVMIICASIAILTTLGIVLSVLFESMRFFNQVPISEFLFGTRWSPQTAIRADQVGG
ncbi:MAG: Phosphate transport system permease protein PstC (TC 3.A.1.7.1), partial [uncultured Thiotrichaceae bacterium]